ncbi:hypothetical protein E2P81_ATG11532 [Venturia nashicola]|uniref:Uncharacterized protein n=1 Tax=Venturia nashicola TaxID=86259 RepID=A0A4Z1PBM0_9PEZI|nr:hypothetical protein E6O75_ATG11220 [Venturia nashicola]TLD35413.1 hypothetical protein E2P81_ATG11532 [Venturia nashicola]
MSHASSNSSLRSAAKFNLDEKDKSDILVYRYRVGLQTSSQEKLCQELDKEPGLRCSKISIPRGHSRVEVHHGDLFPESQRDLIKDKPNFKSSVASVMLPFTVRMRRILFNQHKDLYIVSSETSPNSSPTTSDTSSSHTWQEQHITENDGTTKAVPGSV